MSLGDARLTTATITTRNGLEALREEWDDLLARTGNILPFALHEWLSLWWDHFQQDQLSVRDSLRIVTVREREGKLVAVAPLMLTERPSVGPVRARVLQSLGADPYITELRGVMVDPAHDEAASRALVAHVEKDPSWDWVTWCGLTRGAPLTTAIESTGSLDWVYRWTHYLLPLAPTWDVFKKGLKRNIRESLRHGYNSLKREGIAFRFDVAETPEETARALTDFFRLHTGRAEAENLKSHADRFSTRASRAFLESVVARLAAKRSAKVFTISIGDKVVAARLGFVIRDSLYLYYSGFDPAFGKYGIMTTTVAEALKWAMTQGLASADLSVGTDVAKTRWGPRELVVEDAMRARGRIRSRAVYAAYRAAADARDSPVGRATSFLLGKRKWE